MTAHTISREALSPPRLRDADQQREAEVQMKTKVVAMSGAVAVVAHIDNNILHVASTGDCTAVIGTMSGMAASSFFFVVVDFFHNQK